MINLENLRRKPELLAPAGNRDAFLAALTAGADAIYLGASDFNARRNADNFSFESLAECCDLAHLAGRKVYLTLNTVILPDEMNKALDTAKAAWDVGVDALIVQDLGLLKRLFYDMPQFELHTSTQMNIHNSAGVRLASKMGASRVTLSRELSIEEIARIASEGVDETGRGVPLEVFAHGALCVCYSGQCLFSSLVGRRSANRGLCAQACRLPYQLIDTSTGRRIKTPGEHLLSPADLATIDILPQLCEAGIASIKIEGRMKSAAYVATVTRAYREALDSCAYEINANNVTPASPSVIPASPSVIPEPSSVIPASPSVIPAQAGIHFDSPDKSISITNSPNDALAETFSRGFTTAYLEGDRGNDMMSYSRPNNQGVTVGRVAKLANGIVAVALTKDVNAGDVLEFRTSRGRSTVKLERFWGSLEVARKNIEVKDRVRDAKDNNSLTQAASNSQIFLQVKDPVSIGDRVFRVRNAALQDAAESTYGNDLFKGNNGVVEIVASITAKLDEPLSIGFCLAKDVNASIASVAKGHTVEVAKTRPLTEDAIREHVGRIGGTPFSICSWDISLDEGVGAGFSEIHKLRSDALEQLSSLLLKPWRERKLAAREKLSTLSVAQKGKVRLAVIVADAAGAKAALRAGADLLYLHELNFEANDGDIINPLDALKGFSAKTPIKMLLPAITHDYDLEELADELECGMALVANNLGEIELFGNLGFEIDGGQSLNITNEQSVRALARLGIKQAWLSPELSCHNIAEISASSPLPLALTVFGKQEVMVTEHCLLMAQGPCDQNCAKCVRRKAPRLLEDRKGYKLPVQTDNNGRSHLYNAVALDLIPSMPELVTLGISTMVVDATLLTTKEIKTEVERAVRARDLAVKGAGSLPKREGYTTGHLFRGIY